MGMKAVVPQRDSSAPPHIIYWSGQVRLHVGVVTWCNQDLRANDGILQIPDEVPCCAECEEAVKELRFPKSRG